MKKIILIFLIFLLNSCGYTPIYSSKDSNYKIINFQKNINNNLTNYIQNTINAFSNDDANKSLNIKFEFEDKVTEASFDRTQLIRIITNLQFNIDMR